MSALRRLHAAIDRADQALASCDDSHEHNAGAWVAIPVPPREQWLLLRDLADVPADCMVIGRLDAARRLPDAQPLPALEHEQTATPDASALIERLAAVLRAVAACPDCCVMHRRAAREALAAFLPPDTLALR